MAVFCILIHIYCITQSYIFLFIEFIRINHSHCIIIFLSTKTRDQSELLSTFFVYGIFMSLLIAHFNRQKFLFLMSGNSHSHLRNTTKQIQEYPLFVHSLCFSVEKEHHCSLLYLRIWSTSLSPIVSQRSESNFNHLWMVPTIPTLSSRRSENGPYRPSRRHYSLPECCCSNCIQVFKISFSNRSPLWMELWILN